MTLPRLRKEPLTPEKGAVKKARAVLRQIVEGEVDATFRCQQLNKSWGKRRGQWIAWVEQCGEDEFGFCAEAETQEMAVKKLAHDFFRAVHVCRKEPHRLKTAYREPDWAWKPLKEKNNG